LRRLIHLWLFLWAVGSVFGIAPYPRGPISPWQHQFICSSHAPLTIIARQGGLAVTNETRYVYCGDTVIQERDSNNVPRVSYTLGAGRLARTDSSGSLFYHADGAGNVTALMNSRQEVVARYLYSPFGGTVAQWGSMAEANAWELNVLQKVKEFFTGKPGPMRLADPGVDRAGTGLVTPYTDADGNDVTADLVFDVGTIPFQGALMGPEVEGLEVFRGAARCGKVAKAAKRIRAARTADDLVPVFRGVPSDHINPGIWANALGGKAIPIGGHADAAAHAAGNTRSVFTSWTTDINVARDAATGNGRGVPGVVLKDMLPRSTVQNLMNPHGLPGESELLRGSVEGANVIHVSP
jgi:hypothetical protein